MKNDDPELIQHTLAGDQNAFAKLVKKYQKQVHALAWRKVGDFHIAEEITQDTFLKVYNKLSTLKDPRRFAGWLYRIAARQCQAWLRKKQMQTQSLEDTDIELIEKMTYSQYIVEEQTKALTEAQRDIVQRLLARLPESERTVVTLHYFGEMTCEAIGQFLGVSPSTVKSRLRRARHRLKRLEPMIREALEGFQIRATLTEKIMEEIARIEPTAPAKGQPFVPWALVTSTFVLIVMGLGASSEYLTRFQQPYNFDAPSEMTVELIDTSLVLDIASKPAVQTHFGRSVRRSRGKGFAPNAERPEYVPRFLSTQAKRVVLNDKQPSQDVLGIFRTPAAGYQDYTVVEIDTTPFKTGGVLTIDLWIGGAEAAGAFILFGSDSELSADGMPEVVLTSVSGIIPGKAGRIMHRFDEGARFKLGATGNLFSGEGKVNSFLAQVSVNAASENKNEP